MENKTNTIFIILTITSIVLAMITGVQRECKKVEAPTTYHLSVEKLTIRKVK